MKKIALILTVVLTGCYDLPEPNYYRPANVPTSQYQDVYKDCVKQQAEILDDGVSHANVVGEGIAYACNKEYIAYSMQRVASDNQAVQNEFYHRITVDRNLAAAGPTKYVLSRRNYLNTHNRNLKK